MPCSVLNIVTFAQICGFAIYDSYHVSFMVVKSHLGNSSPESKDSHFSLFNKIKSILFFTFHDLVDLKSMTVDSMWQRSSPPAPTGMVTCAQGSAVTSLCCTGFTWVSLWVVHSGPLANLSVLGPITCLLTGEASHEGLLWKSAKRPSHTLLPFPSVLAAPGSPSF